MAWTDMGDASNNNALSIHSICRHNNVVYAGNSNGDVYYWTGPSTWTSIGGNGTIGAQDITGLLSFDGDLIACAPANNNGVYKYNGSVWSQIMDYFSQNPIDIVLHNDKLCVSNHYGILAMDGDDSWELLPVLPAEMYDWTGMCADDTYIYIARSDSGVVSAYYTNGVSGNTSMGQIHASEGLTGPNQMAVTANGIVYAMTDSGSLFKWTTGTTWTSVSLPTGMANFGDGHIAAMGNNLIVCCEEDEPIPGGYYVYSYDGAWTDLEQPRAAGGTFYLTSYTSPIDGLVYVGERLGS